jgi:hypothetical protein
MTERHVLFLRVQIRVRADLQSQGGWNRSNLRSVCPKYQSKDRYRYLCFVVWCSYRDRDHVRSPTNPTIFIKATAGQAAAGLGLPTKEELAWTRYSDYQIEGSLRCEKKQTYRLDMEARLERMRKFGLPEGGKYDLPEPPSRQDLIQRLRLQGTELPRFWKPPGQPTKPLLVGQSLAYNERLRTAEGEWHVEESAFQ